MAQHTVTKHGFTLATQLMLFGPEQLYPPKLQKNGKFHLKVGLGLDYVH